MANGAKKDQNELPKIDLFNFDSPESRGSRYILTSPRSLKACTRLGIKPLELLPKTLSEFSKDNPLLGNCGGGTLRSVYQEWERERRRKLQAARKERERTAVGALEGRGHKEGMGGLSSPLGITMETKRRHSHPVQTRLTDKDQRALCAMTQHYESEGQSYLLASHLDREWQQQASRAEQNRASRARTLSMERQLRRSVAEARNEARAHQLEQEELAQSRALQHHLEQRDNRVEKTYQLQRKHKEDLIRRASECRGQRSLRVRETLAEIKEELDEWHREVEARRQQSTAQATNTVKSLVAERRARVCSERDRHEASHHERMKQLAEEERQRRLSYTEELELKSERSADILREKNSFLDKSRQAAHASANQRQQIKEKYLRNSFDKMALEAELMASLERKHSTNKTTQSKLF